MDASPGYQVKLELFEGPLDLLLFLIRKKKIDIHDIPIATITREYLEYLNHKEKINLDREAEFLLMASLLIYIKSQMLIPRESDLTEERDPRQMLVERLLDYQRIKAASLLLRDKEEVELMKWHRTFHPPVSVTEEIDLMEVSLFDLAESFFVLMKQKERENIRIIKGKEYSLEEKMKEILAILKENSFLDFLDYFKEQKTLEEAIVSFFSLLELIRARIVIAIQESLFHSIKVWLRKTARPKGN
jgi:segregation and condensation protein A